MLRELRSVAWLGLVAALSGCSYSIDKHPSSTTDLPPVSQYKPSQLTYPAVYSQVLRQSCVGCHGNGGGVNLESYASIKANIDKIYKAVFTDRRMPKAPTAPLTREQLGLLNAWIQSGAPESAPDAEPAPTPIPLAPTFESIKYNILETKCLSCHAPGKPVARIPLVTKEDLLNSPLELVIPGNADESGIMISIRGLNPEKIMPPPKDAEGKPTGFTKLSDQEIDAIALWITNGAKD